MILAVLSSSALLFTAASAQIAAPATPGQAQPTGSSVVSRVVATATAAAGQPIPGQSSAAATSQQPQSVNPNLPSASSAASTGSNAPGSPAPTSSGAAAAVPSRTATGLAATHTVMVGGADNKFFPDMTNVAAGDTVLFSFATSTHNVIQSDTKGGCAKSTSPAAFQFPQAGGLAAQSTTFTYTVPATTKNVWFYCSPHCQTGMVGGLLLGGAAAAGNSTGAGTGVAGAGGGIASSAGSGLAPAATGAPSSSASGLFVPDIAVVTTVVALAAAVF